MAAQRYDPPINHHYWLEKCLIVPLNYTLIIIGSLGIIGQWTHRMLSVFQWSVITLKCARKPADVGVYVGVESHSIKHSTVIKV